MQPSTPHDKKTVHVIMHGRVQGVFYRDSMRREAQRLTVTGCVRNGEDGRVEAVLHGTDAAVDAMVQWAHRGPEHARVERVAVSPTEGTHAEFSIRR